MTAVVDIGPAVRGPEVHDVMGLANFLGGTKAYADKLNSAFERSADAGFIGEGQNGDANPVHRRTPDWGDS